MGHVTQEYKRWVPKADPDMSFPFTFNFVCIKSIDELRQILSQPCNYMGFDTETTGLNQEEIDLVGYSFCLDGKTAYYVPVWHNDFSLGEEAVELIYEKMCNTETVAMFNMRYDTRVMEYRGFTTLYKEIQDKDYTENLIEITKKYQEKGLGCPYKSAEDIKDYAKLKLARRPFIKYDMTKVNTFDVQALVYLVDTNIKYPSLKESEEWYLGWRGASFEETVKSAKNENAVVVKKNLKTGKQEIKELNFFYLTPEEAYQYAAVDALGTYLLGVKLQKFYKEAQYSGFLDIKCLMPLTRFENELTLIDTERLKSYSNKLSNKIEEIQERCWNTVGHSFNIGSVKETNDALKSLNIHTGVTTKNGSMSTSKDAIKQCLDNLKEGDPARPFLKDITDYGTCTKQKSSYIDNIIEMAESNQYHKNRLRFSYKTCEVPSGRLAAGGDKKNRFFASANIQNITKPHVTSHYCLPEDIVKQYYPDVIEAIDKSGTREEARTNLYYLDTDKISKLCFENNAEQYKVPAGATRWSYRIFGWVFSEQPWLIPGVQEYTVEGFIQDLNIRSCFLPDDNYYWVSLDFNAEEIRVPALWSKEPAWSNAFKEGKDVHKSTAVAIWGEENYSKDKRKLAKGANFGLLYGMTANNFKERFNMTMDEAQKFVDDFKAGLPVLMNWITALERKGETNGYVQTMFGRPRRVQSWFDTGEWKWINFAKRTCVNSAVQGTGADILKIVMINLFNTLYNTKEPLTDIVRFKNTIHDEINYQILKKENVFRPILKKIMNIMRVKCTDWEFPMEVGLSIGNRWGQSVDFEFDTNTLDVISPKKDDASDSDICKALGIQNNTEETESQNEPIIFIDENMTIEY